MARRRRLLSLVAVACLVTVAGCGAGASPSARPEATASPVPTAPPTPSPTVAPTDAATGSTFFTLPENWTEVELTEAGLTEADVHARVTEMRSTNPRLASLMDGYLATGILEVFRFAYYAEGFEGDRFVGNMNVIQGPAEGLTLNDAEQCVAGLSEVPDYSLDSSVRVTLPIGEALLFSGTMTIRDTAGAAHSQSQRGYLLIEDDVMYLVTFGCEEGHEPCLADVATIIETFQP
jgi:hypothetical protein